MTKDTWIDRLITDICELSDRSSPEDYPDHMLVTSKELRDLIARQLEIEDERDDAKMWRIEDLIARMQKTQADFGNTCVYVRRGGMGWGAVALNRKANDEKNGVLDLEAQHDKDMQGLLEQIERLKADRDSWMAAANCDRSSQFNKQA